MKLEFVLELKQLSLSEVFVIKKNQPKTQMISEFKQKLKVLMRTEVQNRKAKYCAYLGNYVQLLREVTETENKDKNQTRMK